MISGDEPTVAQRRRIVAEIVAACVFILLLAQALTGLLTLAAYDRLAVTASAERADLLARDTAAKIETGLRLGKPMTQFFGLLGVLERNLAHMPAITGARVVLPDGYVLADWGGVLPQMPALLHASLSVDRKPAAGNVERLASGTVMSVVNDVVMVAVPLRGRNQHTDGVLLLGVDHAAATANQSYLQRSLVALGVTTLGATVLLVVLFGGFMSFAALTRTGGRTRLLVPLAALMLAQMLYAADTIVSFRALWLEATRANVTMLAERMQHDLERVLGMGIKVERLRGVDTLFTQFARSMPAIGEVVLYSPQGRLLVGADAAGAIRAAAPLADDDLRIQLPLTPAGSSAVAGLLQVSIDPVVIRAGVSARILDAATVALISAITVFELFLLLAMLIARSANRAGAALPSLPGPSAQDMARLARPVMFAFLFAWALPLSFLPLYANTLPVLALNLPSELLMALPLSAEMLLGLFGALWAGRLADRRGWPLPVFGGLVLAAGGAAAAAGSPSLEFFTLARAIVGLGYGLAWMGLQGYVVIGSAPAHRGRNIAWLFAGLFAGHLSGTVIGGMLADQISYRLVFVVSAVWMLLALAGAGLLARHSAVATAPRRSSPGAAPAPAAAGVSGARSSWRGLLASRDFVALLAGSVIPFSIVQVGLMYFALPIYLQAQGTSSAGIGRVLMLYGLCMIYLGPPIGRWVDGVRHKPLAIVFGAILGSAGMIWLYWDNSLWAVSLAVVLLALGSCFSGAAQTAWMLSLPRVQQFGPGAATSVLRAADKLGQMIGPLFVGAWFTVMDMGPGLAMTGVFYMLAALGFLAVVAYSKNKVAAAD